MGFPGKKPRDPPAAFEKGTLTSSREIETLVLDFSRTEKALWASTYRRHSLLSTVLGRICAVPLLVVALPASVFPLWGHPLLLLIPYHLLCPWMPCFIITIKIGEHSGSWSRWRSMMQMKM
jgi:hypothetical protein